MASIREFGFCNPVLIDEAGTIIAGHGRVMAATRMKLETVPCLRLSHLSDAQKRAYVIADNRLALNSGWDSELLANELSDLHADEFDLAVLGFDADELSELLKFEMGGESTDETATNGEIVEDEVPDPPPDPITKPGDLWILGEHRLLCGDSTNAADVGRLIDGAVINIAFTSPPYASQRKYDESSGFKPIPPEKFVDWFEPIAANVKKHLAPDGSWFVNIKPACEGLTRFLYVFDLVLSHVRNWGWNFAEEFCWERTGIPQQVTRRFKNQFEPIYQFTTGDWKFRPKSVMHESNSVPLPMGKGAGDTNAAKRQGVVSAVDGNEVVAGMAYPGNRLPKFQSEAFGHAAAFPVGLPTFFIKAYSDDQDCVYEPFCGSGTTLIAAEQLNRKCYGMEISPQYCDVIVKRWENLTGKTAVLEA